MEIHNEKSSSDNGGIGAHWLAKSNMEDDPSHRAMKKVDDAQLEAQRAVEQTNLDSKGNAEIEQAPEEVPMTDLLGAIEGAFLELEQIIQKGRDILSGAAVLVAKIYARDMDDGEEEKDDGAAETTPVKEKNKARTKKKIKAD